MSFWHDDDYPAMPTCSEREWRRRRRRMLRNMRKHARSASRFVDELLMKILKERNQSPVE